MEALSFVLTLNTFDYVKIIFYILVILSLVYFRQKSFPIKRQTVKSKLPILTLVIVLFFCLGSSGYAMNQMLSAYSSINNILRLSKERKVKNFTFNESKIKYKVLVILGESLTKSRMSLFGYQNDTTPYLRKNIDIIKFTNNTTNGINTQPNLQTMLTGKVIPTTGNFNEIAYDLFDILKQKEVKTLVIDNNTFENNNPLVMMKKKATKYININGEGETNSNTDNEIQYDEVVLKYLDAQLINTVSNYSVFFVHLMGSHPLQEKRYPTNFNKFNSFYDNSVLYNDFVVNALFENFIKQTRNEPSVIIYVGDHGVGIPDRNNLNAPEFINYGADDTKINNYNPPLLLWVNDEFKKRSPNYFANIISNQKKAIDQRFLFFSLAQLFGYETIDKLNVSKYSLFSSNANFLPIKDVRSRNVLDLVFKLKKNQKINFLNTRSQLGKFNLQDIPTADNFFGWSAFEENLTWSSKTKFGFNLTLKPANYHICIEMNKLPKSKPKILSLFINNRKIKDIKFLDDSSKKVSFDIHKNFFQNSAPTLDFVFKSDKQYESPIELNLNSDRRKLGFSLNYIEISKKD